jgi:Kef-type K+ transport system membrane component KefB/predicted transcriptional regulator
MDVAYTSSLIARVPDTPALFDPGLMVGLMLLAAFIGGSVISTLHFPRVLGFLIAGIILRITVVAVASRDPALTWQQAVQGAAASTGPLSGLTDLALGLILFFIGAVFERSHLKSVGHKALRISALEMGLTGALVACGCLAVAFLGQQKACEHPLPLGIFLGIAAIATAPAATLLVLREYQAKGPMSDMTLTLTGFNNVAGIILFHIAFLLLASTSLIETRPDPGRTVMLDLFLSTVGSILLGVLLAAALAWFHAKNDVTTLVFLAVLLALGAGRDWLDEKLHLSFSFLLTSITAGAVFSNVAINPERFNKNLTLLSAPIFAIFFVKAGFELHLEDLPKLGWLGGAYLLCRTAGKLLGVYCGSRWSGALATIKPYMGATLLCQAGVVIGLGTFLRANWGNMVQGRFVPDPGAETFYTIILGSVAVFELIGPVLTKQTVVHGGEVKAVQLWSRHASAGPASAGSLIFGALARLLGLQRHTAHAARDNPLAKHLMRTNVKLLHGADAFDEVMHFVEHSRFNHFPVVDDQDKLTGMIHYPDLRDIIYNPALRDLVTAADLADIECPFLTVEHTLPQMMKLFADTEYDSLPVIDSQDTRKVVGIVEHRDVLRLAGRTGPDSSP